MEQLIKNLIGKISKRKMNELAWFEKYKNEESKDLMMISSGKIMEMDFLIHEMKELIKYKSRKNNY